MQKIYFKNAGNAIRVSLDTQYLSILYMYITSLSGSVDVCVCLLCYYLLFS